MNKKIVSMLTVAALAVTLLAGCGSSAQAPASKSSAPAEGSAAAEDMGTVVVGTNPTFEPFEYQDDAGKMTGFDLDLMSAIAEDQGFKVDFQSLEFDSLVGGVQSGAIDAIISGMSITPERSENVLFSKPYMDASLAIIVDKGSEIKSKDDLKGKVVAAQIGTTGADECSALVENGGAADAKLLDNYSTCIQDLKSGGCDAIIIDLPVGQAYMASHPDEVVMLDDPYVADYYGIAVAKDNQSLCDAINAGLDNLIANGKYAEICEKYGLEAPESVLKGTAEAK